MQAALLTAALQTGALDRYSSLYSDTSAQQQRFLRAVRSFSELYGEGRDLYLFSVPGRTEISGNHTDHNRGKVLAASIDRDIIAVVSPTYNDTVRIHSEGFPEDVVDIKRISSPDSFADYSSGALIAGICRAFTDRGECIRGFDAYTTTEVLKGSGISSSAAFEVMVANIINHLYCSGKYSSGELAQMAQYAENVYFGKPCGLMDQMACATGGFVAIDFADREHPTVDSVAFSPEEHGYTLVIVNTGGNHADLNDDYASVPHEMKAVAAHFDREVLRGITEADILAAASQLRAEVGDRAILRALHFIRENDRVTHQTDCLRRGDMEGFLSGVRHSGSSSFKYLQNIYTVKNVEEQGLSLALCLTEGFLGGEGACRVHGGGFAGTVQAYIPTGRVAEYTALMDGVFGKGASMILRVRPLGAVMLDVK